MVFAASGPFRVELLWSFWSPAPMTPVLPAVRTLEGGDSVWSRLQGSGWEPGPCAQPVQVSEIQRGQPGVRIATAVICMVGSRKSPPRPAEGNVITAPRDSEHRPAGDQLLPAPPRAEIKLNSIKGGCDIGCRGNGVGWVAGRAQGRACSWPLGGWLGGGSHAPTTPQPGLWVGAQLPAPDGVCQGASAWDLF